MPLTDKCESKERGPVLISNSAYTIKRASQLKLRNIVLSSDGLICRLIIYFVYLSTFMKTSETKE